MKSLAAADISECDLGNPVSMHCEAVQLQIGQRLRIGFAMPCPELTKGKANLPPEVVVVGKIASDCAEDLQAVERFAASVWQERQEQAEAAAAVVEQAPLRKGRRSAASRASGASASGLASRTSCPEKQSGVRYK